MAEQVLLGLWIKGYDSLLVALAPNADCVVPPVNVGKFKAKKLTGADSGIQEKKGDGQHPKSQERLWVERVQQALDLLIGEYLDYRLWELGAFQSLHHVCGGEALFVQPGSECLDHSNVAVDREG